MKFTFILDKGREEETVVYAHEKTELVEKIERIISDATQTLIGYSETQVIKLQADEVCCFTVEDNKIYALTDKEKLQLKCRLYNLEDTLSDSFIKINKSCIANLKMIDRFSADFSGALKVTFKNGYTEYVSRRNIKNVKERLGL